MGKPRNIICFILFLICSSSGWGQEIDIDSEMISGLTDFENGQFGNALSHFEKVIDFINLSQIEDIPEDALLSLYVVSGTCSQAIGNINQSLNYFNKALDLQNIPEEYLITLLSSKLQLCDYLALENESIETEQKLLDLYNKYKDLGLVQTLVSYYLGHDRYKDIVIFEPDVPFLKSKEDSEINLLSNRIAMENIYNAMGISFFELSDYDKSLKYFLKALDYLTEYTEKDKSIIYAYISKVYDKMGERKNSIRYLEKAIEFE